MLKDSGQAGFVKALCSSGDAMCHCDWASLGLPFFTRRGRDFEKL
ncbi:hypothetical protein RISK_003348 [Rhodopirellula islandica]|uniref:Uncharacterized protein n=1 Tax=Rhodopirellula islandica TaxID=595434 RepID=A0A0J1BDZ0_RHOIS|nr:hypothetical protein RISK_003348 [Rhodopirellula islandica]